MTEMFALEHPHTKALIIFLIRNRVRVISYRDRETYYTNDRDWEDTELLDIDLGRERWSRLRKRGYTQCELM